MISYIAARHSAACDSRVINIMIIKKTGQSDLESTRRSGPCVHRIKVQRSLNATIEYNRELFNILQDCTRLRGNVQ